MGLPAKIVAIIENIAARPDVLEQALDVPCNRLPCPPQVLVRIARAQRRSLADRQPHGHIALERIVGGRLIRDEVEVLATISQLRDDLRRVAEQSDRKRPPFARSVANERNSLVERIRRAIEVAGLEAALDPGRVDLDTENRAAGQS